MLKSPFVLFVASAVLFYSTFAGSIETYEESNSSSASSSGSSSYSSTETKDGKTSSNSNSSAYADASANSSYKSGTKVKCCKNERYVKCPTILCVPNTCDQLGKPISCPRIDPNRCPDKPACVCIEGYVRDCNGVCIPKMQCPSCGGDPNAEAGCGFLCGPKCSGNRPVPEDCPCLLNGCVCKPGFLYDDKQGKCVKEGQCSALCPNPNEIYDSCPLACPPRQCGIDDRAVLCAAGQPCLPPGCRCQDGFVRNDKGVCVTREECPPCQQNEVYTTCANGGCGKWNCTQYYEPDLCIDPLECIPGCVCQDKYLRGPDGTCIPQDDCPAALCPNPNEIYDSCPLACPPRQCGIDDRAVLCAAGQPCLPPGCRCKDGFVRNDKGVCVTREECPPCQQNEVYTTCANGGCGKWNCTQYYEPDLCIDPLECIPGCVCREKYLRGPDGTCIPQDDCPAALCPNSNEIYDSCPLACPPRQCGIDDRAVLCAAGQPCLPPGCRCQDGFVRNDKGVCVTREECPPEPGTYTCDDSVEQLLSDGNNAFTGIFMHESMQTYPNQSCIMSAFSVFVPLGEFMMYSGGNTRNQLKKILNLRSDDDVRCVFPRLTKRLQAEQNVILNMASRTFPSDVYPLSDGFVEETREIFGAGVEPLNFNQPQAAADRINAWVANETNDRIKDIATPSMFNGDTRLVIANAIYFLGNWVDQFNPNNTKDRDFHVNNQKTVKIPTMYQESSFSYGENDTLDCKMLQMDYKGGNFSFLIYLPNDVEGLPALIEKLKQPGVFSDSYQAMFYAKVQVHLPKIKTESEFDLADILKSAGVTDLFDASKSNLTGILKVDDPLFVSAAKQKAFCLVDETGTEAAAANIFVVGVTSVMEPPKVYSFDAKQPFAFYVLYEQRIPIFSGIFYGDSAP
ncbi:uncharacterized protein LOC114351966 isoform X2 [Ostrinia furnacalis]|uniref:uncharacterized protein LOC114351966 isoform X2 n=1 Tax=Ostrinia furnacalis TaxID=93504 RepID=UPI00103C5E76|nr:uncharacterized protein LOC114351966 isoform X2 [Ostrinia furnacalis]XP_028159140.1 uncharacterized protein LOC114351966 isoform X2 [Ostrinia furnacalis]